MSFAAVAPLTGRRPVSDRVMCRATSRSLRLYLSESVCAQLGIKAGDTVEVHRGIGDHAHTVALRPGRDKADGYPAIAHGRQLYISFAASQIGVKAPKKPRVLEHWFDLQSLMIDVSKLPTERG